jgi:hypothetical protein
LRTASALRSNRESTLMSAIKHLFYHHFSPSLLLIALYSHLFYPQPLICAWLPPLCPLDPTILHEAFSQT